MSERSKMIANLFGRSRGDRMVGAQILAQHQLTKDQILKLSNSDIDVLFSTYQKAHGNNGVPFTSDRSEFKRNLIGNLRAIASLAPFFRKRT